MIPYGKHHIDEEDIKLTIEEFRRSHTKVKTVESGADTGDFILCNLQETDFSGNPLIGRKIEKQYLKVGDSHLSDETHTALKGVKQEIKVYCIISHALPETDINKVSAKLDPEQELSLIHI